MKPTQTGIAVALALVVVAILFFSQDFSPFNQSSTPMGTTEQEQALQAATQYQPISATMPTDATQLQTTDDSIGTGATAETGDTVTLNYIGSLTDGTVFDASVNHGSEGFTFNLGAGQVIKGWDLGIVGMKVGGKRTLVIPAPLAYGDQAVGPVIPANATLIFQVELLKVQKPTR